MPGIILDLTPSAERGEIIRCQPPIWKPVPITAARKNDDQHNGENKIRNGIANTDDR